MREVVSPRAEAAGTADARVHHMIFHRWTRLALAAVTGGVGSTRDAHLHSHVILDHRR